MPPSIQTISFNPASQAKSVTQTNDPYVWIGTPPNSPSRAYDGKNRDAGFLSQPDGGYNNGNLTSDGRRTFAYDAENRLRHMGPPQGQTGTTLDLLYDPLGRLMSTTATSGQATFTGFIYDGDRLVGEYGSSGALLRRYVHGPGVDEPLVWYEGANVNWLHADRQGSIIGVSTGSSTTVANTYGPYGEPAQWQARFAYTGQIALPEAQLYHYKARVYDPLMGRFLQTDPVGYDGGDFNLYAYVRGDPTNKTDPTGLQVAELAGAGCAITVEIGCAPGAAVGAAVGGAIVVGGAACAASETCRDFVRGIFRSDQAKPPPNPDGSKGGREHQDKIKGRIEELKGEGKGHVAAGTSLRSV